MDGILVVDKPKGWTSHDVVDFIRKRFSLKKVGHAGTLDPMATGVLVVLIGRCTKSSKFFITDDKEYEGALLLGKESDTGDADGKITSSAESMDFKEDDIRDAFNAFLGTIEQTPPMYSAVKIGGRKLYELARKGIKAEPKPRSIVIKSLNIVNIAMPEISFKVACSKGTYVRQLAVDIGRKIGCGAYLTALKRTRSGRFGMDEALNIEGLKAINSDELERRLLRP
jgi:tRNA pseudouridine55 synthase